MLDTSHTTLARFSFASASTQRRTLHSRQLMLTLSYLVEDSAARAPGTTLIATFQRLSNARPQLARYTHLTEHLAHTYILGVPDADLPSLPNTTVIPLDPAWPLMHEWVVLATGPTCCVSLFAFDSHHSQPAQRSRSFEAHWSVDTTVVDAAYATFLAALGQRTPPIAHDHRLMHQTTRQIQQDMQTQLRALNKKK